MIKRIVLLLTIILSSVVLSPVYAHCELVRGAVSELIGKSFAGSSIPRTINRTLNVRPNELASALTSIGANAGLNASSQGVLMILGQLNYSAQKLRIESYEDSLNVAEQALEFLSKQSQGVISQDTLMLDSGVRLSRSILRLQAEYIRDVSHWQMLAQKYLYSERLDDLDGADIRRALEVISRIKLYKNDASQIFGQESFKDIETFFVLIADEAASGRYGIDIKKLFRARWNDGDSSYLVLGNGEFGTPSASESVVIEYSGGSGGALPPTGKVFGFDEWDDDPEKIFGFPITSSKSKELTHNDKQAALRAITVNLIGLDEVKSLHRKFVQRFMDHESNPFMELFDIERTADGINVVIGEERARALGIADVIPVRSEELSGLQQGKALADNEDLRKLLGNGEGKKSFVAFSSPLDLQSPADLVFQTEVSFALQKSFPNSRILRDRYTKRTRTNVQHLGQEKLGAGKHYLALVAKKSFDVKEQNAINDISEDLEDAGVRVVDVDLGEAIPEDPRDKVIVITGHSDEKLSEYIDYLGNNGVFKNKIVMLNSCNKELTPAMVERITGAYGAKGVLMHEGLVHTGKLSNFYRDFSAAFASSDGDDLIGVVKGLMQKEELNVIWSICKNWLRENRTYG